MMRGSLPTNILGAIGEQLKIAIFLLSQISFMEVIHNDDGDDDGDELQNEGYLMSVHFCDIFFCFQSGWSKVECGLAHLLNDGSILVVQVHDE